MFHRSSKHVHIYETHIYIVSEDVLRNTQTSRILRKRFKIQNIANNGQEQNTSNNKSKTCILVQSWRQTGQRNTAARGTRTTAPSPAGSASGRRTGYWSPRQQTAGDGTALRGARPIGVCRGVTAHINPLGLAHVDPV